MKGLRWHSFKGLGYIILNVTFDCEAMSIVERVQTAIRQCSTPQLIAFGLQGIAGHLVARMDISMFGLIGKLFSSPLFTWWNSASIGTRLFTSRRGVKVGEDSQGNIYYREKNGRRRWVIYKNGPVEASRVPAEWHGWLHYTVDTAPTESPIEIKDWETAHVANATGTAAAYNPQGSLAGAGKHARTTSDYEAWTPGE